jgi:DNA (cytosine-5)-methyltransferase 1
MIFGSVCSGIEAASVAWEPLGWKAAWYSEIEAFPSAVLAHRFPEVPNLGDMTTIQNRQEFTDGAIDLLVGGTPCQSFSVAGLRAGMDDPRGNLALVYLRLASIARPRWIVWENVPGVLSSNGGRDFGAFLAALGHLGYGWAYRVLDAQYFGVAQRRRRVFVVGHAGDWRRAAAVLFEQPGSGGHPTAGSSTRAQVAQCLTAGVGKRYDPETETLITEQQRVRRLTPRECERLQGFPDDWTLVPYRGREAADGPRYKACGNSMAVPVMRWIGQRISQVEAIA